jgi:ABC-type amino acid transport system permease subunit
MLIHPFNNPHVHYFYDSVQHCPHHFLKVLLITLPIAIVVVILARALGIVLGIVVIGSLVVAVIVFKLCLFGLVEHSLLTPG